MKTAGTVLAAVLIFTSTLAIGGAVPMPRYDSQVLLPGQSYFYILPFYGKLPAEVLVRGSGNSDIDCAVYDRYGNVIDNDLDSTATCALNWYPDFTAPYRIIITNNGSYTTRFYIQTN